MSKDNFPCFEIEENFIEIANSLNALDEKFIHYFKLLGECYEGITYIHYLNPPHIRSTKTSKPEEISSEYGNPQEAVIYRIPEIADNTDNTESKKQTDNRTDPKEKAPKALKIFNIEKLKFNGVRARKVLFKIERGNGRNTPKVKQPIRHKLERACVQKRLRTCYHNFFLSRLNQRIKSHFSECFLVKLPKVLIYITKIRDVKAYWFTLRELFLMEIRNEEKRLVHNRSVIEKLGVLGEEDEEISHLLDTRLYELILDYLESDSFERLCDKIRLHEGNFYYALFLSNAHRLTRTLQKYKS